MKSCTEGLNDALITAKALELSKHYHELRNKFKASRSWLCKFKGRNGIECPANGFVISHSHLADSNIGINVDATVHSSPSRGQRSTLFPQPHYNYANDQDFLAHHEINDTTAERVGLSMDGILPFANVNMDKYFSEHIMREGEMLCRWFGNEIIS